MTVTTKSIIANLIGMIVLIEGQITDFFFAHLPQNHKKITQKNHKKNHKIARKIMKITLKSQNHGGKSLNHKQITQKKSHKKIM